MEASPNTYIFCYGSNHPEQIARRLEVPLKEVLEKCRACTLKGYKRAYMGTSRNWGGSSPATVVEDPNSEVKAFAFLMTAEQVTKMDGFEHYPVNYDRKHIQLVDKEGVTFPAQVYVLNPKDEFNHPCDAYLDA